MLVVRPLAGYAALALRARDEEREGGLDRGEMMAVAFFGVRGVGSLYYLAYATSHEHVPDEPWLWSTVAFTVIVSVLLHGVSATPVMARLDARRSSQPRPDPPSGGAARQAVDGRVQSCPQSSSPVPPASSANGSSPP